MPGRRLYRLTLPVALGVPMNELVEKIADHKRRLRNCRTRMAPIRGEAFSARGFVSVRFVEGGGYSAAFEVVVDLGRCREISFENATNRLWPGRQIAPFDGNWHGFFLPAVNPAARWPDTAAADFWSGLGRGFHALRVRVGPRSPLQERPAGKAVDAEPMPVVFS